MKSNDAVAAPERAITSSDEFSLSLAELHHVAHASETSDRRLLGTSAVDLSIVVPSLPVPTPYACTGVQELLSLSDDLLLVRSNFDAQGAGRRPSRWQLDSRGWLYLHFRLDGLTCDQTSDGRRHTIGGGSFFLTASSKPVSIVREVLADGWRAVTVAFQPSFADRDLRAPDAALPTELRRFQSGDAEVDFFFASQLTADMGAATRALLSPSINTDVRPIYLRAKVVELICLAIEQLRFPSSETEPPLRLSYRDTRALEEARRVLDCGTEPVSLEQLARRVGLNRRKLALGFKMLFGATVCDYHRQVRLALAYRLLSGTSSVGYAAAVAGYSDVGSFGKAFRAHYGCLPSDIRSSAAARRLPATPQ